MANSLYVRGMEGLGDNIYQRPFIRTLADKCKVYLSTPWPELYGDIGVRFVYRATSLRTQRKNIERQLASIWSEPPNRTPDLLIGYSMYLENLGLYRGLAESFGVEPTGPLDLPEMDKPTVDTDKPLAVVRPVTRRKEWESKARGPLPEYVAYASRELMYSHHVVVVADVDGDSETFVGNRPQGHTYYIRGELDVAKLLGLIQVADALVGGVGWIVPASIATNTPLLCILGGRGAHNGPDVIAGPMLEPNKITWLEPDNYCLCNKARHNCDKTISNYQRKVDKWINSVIL